MSVSSFVMRSPIRWNMVVPPDNTTLSCRFERHTSCCSGKKCRGFRKPLSQWSLAGPALLSYAGALREWVPKSRGHGGSGSPRVGVGADNLVQDELPPCRWILIVFTRLACHPGSLHTATVNGCAGISEDWRPRTTWWPLTLASPRFPPCSIHRKN